MANLAADCVEPRTSWNCQPAQKRSTQHVLFADATLANAGSYWRSFRAMDLRPQVRPHRLRLRLGK
jgi:hypothetical protein